MGFHQMLHTIQLCKCSQTHTRLHVCHPAVGFAKTRVDLWTLIATNFAASLTQVLFFFANLEMCAHMLNLTWKHLSA